MPQKTSDRPSIFTVLLNCGIRMNLMRLDAEADGRMYDRNRIVYAYFRRFTANRDKDIQRMAKLVTVSPTRAGYVFDQYFIMWIGFKPTPDAHELGQVIKKGLKDHGYATAI